VQDSMFLFAEILSMVNVFCVEPEHHRIRQLLSKHYDAREVDDWDLLLEAAQTADCTVIPVSERPNPDQISFLNRLSAAESIRSVTACWPVVWFIPRGWIGPPLSRVIAGLDRPLFGPATPTCL
jgi:hypothetical protein